MNRFHRKQNRIRQHLLHYKQSKTRKFNDYDNKQPAKRLDSTFPDLEVNQLKQTSAVLEKNWWTPVWSGLVLDKEAKHKTAIRQAIWLYLYLLTVANRRNGQLFRRLKTIARETGFHPRSIERWLKQLREGEYIETHSTGRYLQISITRWKPIFKKNKKGINQLNRSSNSPT
jgi:hypothetical protein